MLRKFSILFTLFLCQFLAAQEDFRIISANSNSITVEYSPLYTDTSFVSIDGKQFYSVNLYKGLFQSNPYKSVPNIPNRIINLGVNSEFGNTIQVLDAQYDVVNGQIIPTPVFVEESNKEKADYLISNDYMGYSQPELVTFGDYGLVREQQVQNIIINPVIFDPATRNIKIYSKIRFRVNFFQTESKL